MGILPVAESSSGGATSAACLRDSGEGLIYKCAPNNQFLSQNSQTTKHESRDGYARGSISRISHPLTLLGSTELAPQSVVPGTSVVLTELVHAQIAMAQVAVHFVQTRKLEYSSACSIFQYSHASHTQLRRGP